MRPKQKSSKFLGEGEREWFFHALLQRNKDAFLSRAELVDMAVDRSAPKPKVEKLVRLYPKVSERETPLPRSWSAKDKYTYIGLSQNNLRVHYKGEASGISEREGRLDR